MTVSEKKYGAQFEEESDYANVEEFFKQGHMCLGSKVLVSLGEDTYVGIVNHVLSEPKKVYLEQVCSANTGKKKPGLLMLFMRNIDKLKVIKVDTSATARLSQDVEREQGTGRKLLMKKFVPMHLLEDSETTEVDENVLLGKAPPQQGVENENDVPPLPHPINNIARPSDFFIIDSLGKEFDKAVAMIKNESFVGMCVTGSGLGRNGYLAWLSVAVSSVIMLFDVAKIGAKEVLSNGFQDILTSTTLLKVIHDCRPLEDFLHHKHHIGLRGIFDTQAAEVYLHFLYEKGTSPMLLMSLPALLIKYLNLHPRHIFYKYIREECAERDESVWFERPISNALCEGLAKNTKFLRELKLVMMQNILADMTQIMQLFLGAYRDLDTEMLSRVESFVVPEQIQKLASRSVRNSVGVYDPYVHFSKDMFKLGSKRRSR